MTLYKIKDDIEYQATLEEIEYLWRAPVGELDVSRIMELRQRIQAYDAERRRLADE